MSVSVIFCLFSVAVLVLPVILWVIPKTRRCAGNWCIAWKTVPAGIWLYLAAAMLLAGAGDWLREWSGGTVDIPVWSIRLAAFAASWIAIVRGGLWIKKRYAPTEKYRVIPSILLYVLYIPMTTIALLTLAVAVYAASGGHYRGAWQSIRLPAEGNTALAFEQQSIHPFLAEYNYRLKFVCGGKTSFQGLFVNCGGRTHFNLYRLKDGRLLLRDKDRDYLVDAPKRQVLLLTTFEGRFYAAPLPDEEIGSWGTARLGDGSVVMYINRHAIPAQEVTGVLDGMSYYGCIRQKFYPASQMPEKPVIKTADLLRTGRTGSAVPAAEPSR